MKKRIQTLMFMTLMAFLFSGLTTLNAQSFTTGPAEYGGVNGKVLIDYVDNAEALTTVESEITTNYPNLNLPQPTTLTAAETFYRQQYLISVRGYLGAGQTTASAIYRGYNEVVEASKGNWATLVDEAWMDDMISLLSN